MSRFDRTVPEAACEPPNLLPPPNQPLHPRLIARALGGRVAGQDRRGSASGRVARFGVARGAVESALGSADAAGPGFLAYRLPGRSGYRYTFALDPASSCVRWSGFEREGPAPDPPRVPSEAAAWPAFAASLATLGATEAELRAWLGEPLDSFGFWPVETWEYPLGVLGLRHGVVESEPGDS